MELVVFFFLSWLVIGIYITLNKRIDIVANTFVFLVILVVSINFSWIIIDELKLISTQQNWLSYTAYILNRSIIIPMLILLHLNLLIKYKSFTKKAFIFISAVIFLLIISYISTRLNITEFYKWTFWFEGIYYVCLNLTALLSYTLFNRTTREASV